jgi:hypothetical protein
MLLELNETLECIIPYVYHLDPIMVGKSISSAMLSR